MSGNYINAYGQQMKNLSAPTDLSDATTKQYEGTGKQIGKVVKHYKNFKLNLKRQSGNSQLASNPDSHPTVNRQSRLR